LTISLLIHPDVRNAYYDRFSAATMSGSHASGGTFGANRLITLP
jgi:hypothetical protein